MSEAKERLKSRVAALRKLTHKVKRDAAKTKLSSGEKVIAATKHRSTMSN